ncbi:MAG: hypothetical protein DMF93_21215 [Acidobacteria bacterium]|nr:MAG: hypothetical protein DMF93_21215 [Acidobacteriota bacterium]
MAPPRVPPPLAAAPSQQTAAKIDVAALNFYYGMRRALDGITLTIRSNEVTALIGPSGCGKSTFLRTLNRMNDIVPAARVEGAVTIDGDDIYDSFRAYQNKLLREYSSMADEFHFRVVDARRPVDRIQDELRKNVAAFLEPAERPADRSAEGLVFQR